ncbi:MAG: hypothetical protein CVV46_08325 [Spirochaetae bacterium HGW-Spirochaetae-2]|jgi:hypothetical protein|nr:MAG: hypothetical protein CVV46_08325 [Spirochaetae bacterium HGW-Spirochaetae-2]
MHTVLVGFDNGTKDYLGRREANQKGKNNLAKSLINKWERMKRIRQKTESLRWEACAYVQHRMDEFSIGKSPVRAVKLYNTSGIEAFETFVNGYHGNLISPAMRWFSLILFGENYEDVDTIHGANDFLELCETRMYGEFNKSNFYPMDKLATKDAAVQGTSAEFIIDDVERGQCIYDALPPWDFWIDSNSRGRIDTIFYRYDLTAEQAQERFGDKIPEEIALDIEQDNGDSEHEFLLAIYPRKSVRDDKGKILISTNKPFAAVTYSKSGDCVIDESGYDDFPVAVHIWEPDGTSVYGKGLVMKYLAELKRLNAMCKDELIAVQKTGRPPWIIHESQKGRFSPDPDARNYIGNMENMPRILQTVQDVGWVSNEIVELEGKIKKLFFNDLFNYLMQQNKVLTATQVQAIKNEELVLLSSILGTTQFLKINPIVKRTFTIMVKGKRLPQPPKELLRIKDALMKIELDGPLARNVKAYTMQDGLTSSLEILQTLQAMQLQNTFDNVDMDKFARRILTGAGLPQDVLREIADRERIRVQKQQMIEQQMQMQQAQAASEVARNMGGQGNLNNAQGAN